MAGRAAGLARADTAVTSAGKARHAGKLPLALGGAVLIALVALVVVVICRRRSPPLRADEPMNEYRG